MDTAVYNSTMETYYYYYVYKLQAHVHGNAEQRRLCCTYDTCTPPLGASDACFTDAVKV